MEVEGVVVVVVVVNCRRGPEYDHRIAQKTGWTMLRYCKKKQRSKCVLKYKIVQVKSQSVAASYRAR